LLKKRRKKRQGREGDSEGEEKGARICMCNSAEPFHLGVRYSRQIKCLILLLIKK
jgi:hypothetical protein